MSQKSHSDTDHAPMPQPLDLSKWRNLPVQMLIVGLLVGLLGLAVSYKGGGVDFLFAYLTAFMFILSLGAGSLLLVMQDGPSRSGERVKICPSPCSASPRFCFYRSESLRRRFIRG
jgi:hypothetical protein